ncbi:MAG: type II toxin-antitoxin system RelE/ParE family toxin [Alphaproteobacteria bacterium]
MKLRITARANRDLQDIAGYLNSRNPSAAAVVRDRIERALQLLIAAPKIGRMSERAGLREFPVRDLPYLIVYRVNSDAVEILSVFHGARDPEAKP